MLHPLPDIEADLHPAGLLQNTVAHARIDDGSDVPAAGPAEQRSLRLAVAAVFGGHIVLAGEKEDRRICERRLRLFQRLIDRQIRLQNDEIPEEAVGVGRIVLGKGLDPFPAIEV